MDTPGKVHKLAVLCSGLLTLSHEKAAKAPVTMLEHLAEFNYRYDPGKRIFIQKTCSIAYKSSFWLLMAVKVRLASQSPAYAPAASAHQ